MTSRERRLMRLRNAVKSSRFEEVEAVLLAEGFFLDRVEGSHHVYVHRIHGHVDTVVPRHRGTVLPYIVRKCLLAIDEVRRLEAGGDS